MYEEVKNAPAKKHSLSLESRSRLIIEGVEDVSGFDENLVILKTARGVLNIRGRQLHVEKIELGTGELELKGHIQELSYDEPESKNGLWHRFFG